MLRGVLPGECAVSLQTNGILISDEILDMCSETRTTISVSLDGPRHIHDRFRVGHTGQGTYDKVLAGIERLRHHPDATFLFTGLLAVVDPESDPTEVYSFFKSLDPPSVDFIYRDGNHSRLPYGKTTLHSTEYGAWMGRLLDVYLADLTPIRIRILDDVIKGFAHKVLKRGDIMVRDYFVVRLYGQDLKSGVCTQGLIGAGALLRR
jgi:uncharacterized protein